MIMRYFLLISFVLCSCGQVVCEGEYVTESGICVNVNGHATSIERIEYTIEQSIDFILSHYDRLIQDEVRSKINLIPITVDIDEKYMNHRAKGKCIIDYNKLTKKINEINIHVGYDTKQWCLYQSDICFDYHISTLVHEVVHLVQSMIDRPDMANSEAHYPPWFRAKDSYENILKEKLVY